MTEERGAYLGYTSILSTCAACWRLWNALLVAIEEAAYAQAFARAVGYPVGAQHEERLEHAHAVLLAHPAGELGDDWDITCQLQDDGDAHRRAQAFTGVAFDSTTGDYAAWLHGHLLAYAPTPAAAQQRVAEERQRTDLLHASNGANERSPPDSE